MKSGARSVVALRHVAFEDLGLLAPILAADGWSVSYLEAPTADLDDPAIERADLLVVLGGPIGVYDVEAYPFLAQETALLERRLAKDRPTLGICLGGQLMAKALGARVFPGPAKQIGWDPVSLTDAGRTSCLTPLADDGAAVLHWHGDTFDLPRQATRLAADALYENQAFACGRNGLALQFHLKADPRQMEAWYVGHAAELSGAGIAVQHLRAATTAVAGRLRAQAARVFTAWLGQTVGPDVDTMGLGRR